MDSSQHTAPIAAPRSDRLSLERILARDRLIVSLGLVTLIALSWYYLVAMSSAMQSMARQSSMAAMGMPEMGSWGIRQAFALFIMWAVMMVGMMLPSAAPMILLVLGVYRRRGDRGARVHAAVFVAGYLLAWSTFSAGAAALQALLHRAALLTPNMAVGSAIFGAALLLVAGVYQWLPLKNSCLTLCRSPLDFLTRHWREGSIGALRMGLHHGLFCVGCCWALMALLFLAGVMNLLWVAAIAVFVLAEKLAPQSLRLSRIAGAALLIWGAYVLISALHSAA